MCFTSASARGRVYIAFKSLLISRFSHLVMSHALHTTAALMAAFRHRPLMVGGAEGRRRDFHSEVEGTHLDSLLSSPEEARTAGSAAAASWSIRRCSFAISLINFITSAFDGSTLAADEDAASSAAAPVVLLLLLVLAGGGGTSRHSTARAPL